MGHGGRDRTRRARLPGWRFGSAYAHPDALEAAGRETYKYYYRLRYPLDAAEWGRPGRVGPLHGATQDLGAVYGAKNGWERPTTTCPAGRGGGPEPTSATTAGRGRRSSSASARHAAFRERVGIIDMTSFGKIEVEGPRRLALLDRVCANRIDRPLGSVVYTQWCNAAAGSSPT